MKRNNQYGFGVIEILMALAIVVLLGVVIYFAIQANQKKDQTSTASLSQTSSASPQASPAPKNEAPAALANVKAFYKTYLNDFSSNTGPLFSSYVNEGYMTQAADDQENNTKVIDPTTCGQGVLNYDEYTFSIPTINGKTGTMIVNGVGSAKVTVTIGLDLVKDGSVWKVDKFHCSQYGF